MNISPASDAWNLPSIPSQLHSIESIINSWDINAMALACEVIETIKKEVESLAGISQVTLDEIHLISDKLASIVPDDLEEITCTSFNVQWEKGIVEIFSIPGNSIICLWDKAYSYAVSPNESMVLSAIIEKQWHLEVTPEKQDILLPILESLNNKFLSHGIFICIDQNLICGVTSTENIDFLKEETTVPKQEPKQNIDTTTIISATKLVFWNKTLGLQILKPVQEGHLITIPCKIHGIDVTFSRWGFSMFLKMLQNPDETQKMSHAVSGSLYSSLRKTNLTLLGYKEGNYKLILDSDNQGLERIDGGVPILSTILDAKQRILREKIPQTRKKKSSEKDQLTAEELQDIALPWNIIIKTLSKTGIWRKTNYKVDVILWEDKQRHTLTIWVLRLLQELLRNKWEPMEFSRYQRLSMLPKLHSIFWKDVINNVPNKGYCISPPPLGYSIPKPHNLKTRNLEQVPDNEREIDFCGFNVKVVWVAGWWKTWTYTLEITKDNISESHTVNVITFSLLNTLSKNIWSVVRLNDRERKNALPKLESLFWEDVIKTISRDTCYVGDLSEQSLIDSWKALKLEEDESISIELEGIHLEAVSKSVSRKVPKYRIRVTKDNISTIEVIPYKVFIVLCKLTQNIGTPQQFPHGEVQYANKYLRTIFWDEFIKTMRGKWHYIGELLSQPQKKDPQKESTQHTILWKKEDIITEPNDEDIIDVSISGFHIKTLTVPDGKKRIKYVVQVTKGNITKNHPFTKRRYEIFQTFVANVNTPIELDTQTIRDMRPFLQNIFWEGFLKNVHGFWHYIGENMKLPTWDVVDTPNKTWASGIGQTNISSLSEDEKIDVNISGVYIKTLSKHKRKSITRYTLQITKDGSTQEHVFTEKPFKILQQLIASNVPIKFKQGDLVKVRPLFKKAFWANFFKSIWWVWHYIGVLEEGRVSYELTSPSRNRQSKWYTPGTTTLQRKKEGRERADMFERWFDSISEDADIQKAIIQIFQKTPGKPYSIKKLGKIFKKLWIEEVQKNFFLAKASFNNNDYDESILQNEDGEWLLLSDRMLSQAPWYKSSIHKLDHRDEPVEVFYSETYKCLSYDGEIIIDPFTFVKAFEIKNNALQIKDITTATSAMQRTKASPYIAISRRPIKVLWRAPSVWSKAVPIRFKNVSQPMDDDTTT